MPLKLAIVEAELIEAARNAHVTFVKDGSPLHGSAVQRLTDRAVTDFRVHRLCAHFVLDSLTMAAGTIFCRKRFIPCRCKCCFKCVLHSHNPIPLCGLRLQPVESPISWPRRALP